MQDVLTPEQYAELLRLGQENAGLEGESARMLEQAQALRAGPLEMRGSGRIQTAPHFLELFGNLAREKSSGDVRAEAEKKKKGILANTQSQQALMLRALAANSQPPSAPPVGPGMGLPQGPSNQGMTGELPPTQFPRPPAGRSPWQFS
jgi:hypothetical protein